MPTHKLSLFVMICFSLLPSLSQAEFLTANVVTNHQHIKVVRNYSSILKTGIIATPLCYTCEASDLTLTLKSTLLVHGVKAELEDLLTTSLKHKESYIRIQYYKQDMTINYIEWGQDPKEVGAPL